LRCRRNENFRRNLSKSETLSSPEGIKAIEAQGTHVKVSKILEEPILQENKNRFVIFPIKHHDIWEWYKKDGS
jgi:hypothetical protein